MLHEHPYGSARFAEDREITRAFRQQGGIPFGFHRGRKLYHSKGAGMVVYGGAGSGKLTGVLAHVMNSRGREGQPQRCAILDPKGEIAAVIGPGLVHMGAHVYYVNAYGLSGLPNHTVSLFSHLNTKSPRLVADCRRAVRNWVQATSQGDGRFFEQTGQGWLDPIMRGLIHAEGQVAPLSLAVLVGMIRSNPAAWNEMSEILAAHGEPDLAVTYQEIQTMSEDSPRTFGSVISELSNAVAVMHDPALQKTFVGKDQADFSLEVLLEESNRSVFVFLMMPDDLIEQNAALIRQFFSTLRTIKQCNPYTPTVNLYLDEAARLSRFPEIAEFYSIGRSSGICPICFYQDRAQVRKNLGEDGATSLSASSDIEIYLGGGVSDFGTAQYISNQLGRQTIQIDDALTQERARRAKRDAVYAVLRGEADALQTGLSIKTLNQEIQHKTKTGRFLLTPDEILNMPHDKMLVWASGYGIPAFAADKVMYWTSREYAGRFFQNPQYSSDLDAIRVRTRFGYRMRRVIREPVPAAFKDFPQYQNGEWQFIEGYRPKPK